MVRSLIALGANLDDRAQQLDRAVELLRAVPEISGLVASRWIASSPVGGPPGQGPFLNSAAAFETSLTAEQLLALLRRFELALGRTPGERWSARAIDLDLLLYGGEVLHSPSLRVPHPRMAFRRFVLTGSAEVAADMRHPLLGRTVGELLEHLDAALPYVALAGIAGSGKTLLATMLAEKFGGRLLADPCAETKQPDSTALPSLPSHIGARPIEFLDRSAILGPDFDWHDAPLWVSDFYFDQCLAYAEVELGSSNPSERPGSSGEKEKVYAEFCAAWSERTVIAPKLVVVLEAPPAAKTANVEQARLQAALVRVATRPGAGPVLFVPGDWRAGVTEKTSFPEICAAIEAMR